MEFMEKKILETGKVLEGDILYCGNFLNQNMDINLYKQMADAFYEHFKDKHITKVLSIEASGIAIACATALRFDIDFAFAKKNKESKNINGALYVSQAYSFTHKKTYDIVLGNEFLNENDNVLIVDDFLANGAAINALVDICHQAKAHIMGMGIAIEKGFQGGGDKLRNQGFDVFSLAIVQSMENGKVIFRK